MAAQVTDNKPTPQQLNAMARAAVTRTAVPMCQPIFSTTIPNPPANTVVNVPPRNVGLIMGFYVKVQMTLHNTTGGAVAITPSDFGGANVLSQIVFKDLNNNIRVQTPGWHINALNSIKGHKQFASALLTTAQDGQAGITGEYGSNVLVNNQPATIADTASGTVTFWYYVPLAYSHGDYRGAIYANVVNATMNLQLTINPTPIIATASDTTNAVYIGAAAAGSDTSVTITVYQDYLDQLPYGANGPILPLIDLSTVYEIKQTTFSGIVPNRDFPMQYANFRDFLSTVVVYFNGTARVNGTDINNWLLQSANFTNLFDLEPGLVALRTRALLGTDLPRGMQYFGSRARPISTTQYGNMELVINASVAGATAYALTGYEAFALTNTLTQAGSLPAS